MSADEEVETEWWALGGGALRSMLIRAHAGESPDLLYMELYANSDHEEVEGD